MVSQDPGAGDPPQSLKLVMRTWPHAPSRLVTQPGVYMYTASTLHKEHFFRDPGALEYLHDLVLEVAEAQGWHLEAWAIFSNHYHFVGKSPDIEGACETLAKSVHKTSASWLNAQQGQIGRRVWYSYRQTLLTYEKSYMARLSYVHRNAVHHGLVDRPEDYRFCSARWLLQNATPAFSRTLMEFPIDRVNVEDDF